MGIQRISNAAPTELSREQKVAFALLAFLGIGGLILGFRSFGANLNRPIQQQIVEHFTGKEYLSPEQKLTKEREEQRKQDTDFDGLNDYDELYVYRSSAYLADSDSDGVDDRTEVFAGQDPNCPQGKQCGPLANDESAVSSTSAEVQALLGVFEDTKGAIEAGSVEFKSGQDVKTYLNGLTSDQIRQALRNSGMSEEQLNLIDDATLQSYFSGAIEKLETQKTPTEPESEETPSNSDPTL